ncbi:type II toxin-antitoxin system PemK/MazF family toxin [Hymenobacter sp.]|uniref:type II toxin-antitoxin system PemK/MazF family toxin n=1 Tax=Hymenobacter sp. TaxID=1898978 RepID=UPI00286A7E7A|nr:type II toxin-antitoxin system PemK/MazF family toxin [Hymenobacter sp.]
MKKGDILSVQFPFTNMQVLKRRPALVVAVEAPDVTVAFITSNLDASQPYDVLLQPTALNRLKQVSLVRVVKMATLDPGLIYGRIGELTATEQQQVDAGLRLVLQLF